MSDNVIQFPRRETEYPELLPSTIQEAEDMLVVARREYAAEISESCLEIIIDMAHSFSYFKNPAKIYAKDLVLIEEAIKSALHRYGNVDHPLHLVVDKLIVEEELNQG